MKINIESLLEPLISNSEIKYNTKVFLIHSDFLKITIWGLYCSSNMCQLQVQQKLTVSVHTGEKKIMLKRQG